MAPIEDLIRAQSHLHRTFSVTLSVIQHHKDSIEIQVSLSHKLKKRERKKKKERRKERNHNFLYRRAQMVPTLAEGSPGPGTSRDTAHPDAEQRLGTRTLPSVDISPITLCRKWTSAMFRETLGGKQSKGCRGCRVDYKLSESSSGSAGFPGVARVGPEKRGPLSHSGPSGSHGPQSKSEEEVTRRVESRGKESGMALRMAPVLRTQKDSDARQTQV